MKKTQQVLAKLKLPFEDNHALKPTGRQFPNGGHYRIEIPSVEGPRVFRQVLDSAKEYRVPVHRISQGSGILLLTTDEIREMVRMGADEGVETAQASGVVAQDVDPVARAGGRPHTFGGLGLNADIRPAEDRLPAFVPTSARRDPGGRFSIAERPGSGVR